MSIPMLRILRGFLALTLTLILNAAVAAAPIDAADASPPAIQVVDGGWGSGEPAEIGKVLASVAAEFPVPVADGARPPIRVLHRFGGPMIDYDRDRKGWVVVHLSARDDRWYQYVYQFAHEYCHLLAHFERKQHGGEIQRKHQWFEETLCETASLFALRRLAVKWRDAPDAQLREAAPQLAQYLGQLLAEPQRRLPAGAERTTWYSQNREALEREPYLRESNELAATWLLPLFEQDPGRWAALAYLNPASPPLREQSFTDFLAAWSAALPPELKPLVAEIRAIFGVQPSGASGAAP